MEIDHPQPEGPLRDIIQAVLSTIWREYLVASLVRLYHALWTTVGQR